MRHIFGIFIGLLMLLVIVFAIRILFKGLPPELAASRFIPSATVDNPECGDLPTEEIEISKVSGKTRLYNYKFNFEIPEDWEVENYEKNAVLLFNSKKQSLGTFSITRITSSCYEETKKYLGNLNNKEAIDGYFEERGSKYMGFDITNIEINGKVSYEKEGVYYRGNALDLTTTESNVPLRLNTVMALSKDSMFSFIEVTRNSNISINETNALFSRIQIN